MKRRISKLDLVMDLVTNNRSYGHQLIRQLSGTCSFIHIETIMFNIYVVVVVVVVALLHLANICKSNLWNVMDLSFFLKCVFSASNNLFLWHESVDRPTNNKTLFPKSQLLPILHKSKLGMIMCILWLSPYIEHCVEFILVEIALSS